MAIIQFFLSRVFLPVFFLLLSGTYPLWANGLTVSNVTLTAPDAAAGTIKVQFDIAWNNSWRNVLNYDAAWVFAKYSTDSGTTWHHAALKTAGLNPAGFSAGSMAGLDVLVPSDVRGAFIQRSSNGGGNIASTGVQLVWDWDAANLDEVSSARVQVFAVEMVYIPQGSFYVGDGTTSSVQGQLHAAGSVTTPFQITSEAELTLGGGGAGSLGNNNTSGMATADDFNNTTSKTLPVAFPKGYGAFYVMKYEVSQQQWVDFFNTLTDTQKASRDITGGVLNSTGKASDGTVNRNTLSWTSGLASAGANAYVACNFLSWMDQAAYAAWAALRPFTELEYEKMSRGTANAVANEYVWGTTNITQVTGISNSGAANEIASNAGNGLCVHGNHGSVQGPLRTGFAAWGSTNRQTAGASFYGVMELSGNLWERPVSVGNATGRGFTGTHGSGSLSTNGFATNSDWPGYVTAEVTAATGSGFRGGSWYKTSVRARVSDRYSAASVGGSRHGSYGARCARTSP